jgi:hypothetical protein
VNEFLPLAALITLAATSVGLLIAGVAHCVVATERGHRLNDEPPQP